MKLLWKESEDKLRGDCGEMIDINLVNRWQKAYEKANGEPAPDIKYSYGWYRVSNNYSNPFRHWKLERITETLEERAGIMSPPLGGVPNP